MEISHSSNQRYAVNFFFLFNVRNLILVNIADKSNETTNFESVTHLTGILL
jgi:hypothetical protein